MDWPEVVTICISAAASGLAAYVGSYAKRKGENLATREDFRDLVDQTRALTEATKRIEATITQEVWDRQRQWELKRDALFAALEPIGRIDGILIRLAASLKRTGDPNEQNVAFFKGKRDEAAEQWLLEMEQFDARRRLLLLPCSRTTCETLMRTSRTIRLVGGEIFRGAAGDIESLGQRVQNAREAAFSAARVELGLAPLETQ